MSEPVCDASDEPVNVAEVRAATVARGQLGTRSSPSRPRRPIGRGARSGVMLTFTCDAKSKA